MEEVDPKSILFLDADEKAKQTRTHPNKMVLIWMDEAIDQVGLFSC